MKKITLISILFCQTMTLWGVAPKQPPVRANIKKDPIAQLKDLSKKYDDESLFFLRCLIYKRCEMFYLKSEERSYEGYLEEAIQFSHNFKLRQGEKENLRVSQLLAASIEYVPFFDSQG